MSRFNYVRYDEYHSKLQESFKAKFEELERSVTLDLPDSRAKALVLTKIEEAYMWVGKAIRDNQIALGGDASHIAERTQS